MRRRRTEREASNAPPAPTPESKTRLIEAIPVPPGDPLETLLLSSGGPIGLKDLELESEALDSIRAAGVELIVPLIGQGELLGALYLGPRLSDQPYSTDDRRLLGSLASQVAPAMKVAQLVREQQAEAEERERIQQELQVAALIQQTLLPKELPAIPGWHVDAFYRPARAVGGDFYDFIALDDGRLGVVIGDVTDKGVPAALVMATCRSMLRAAAQRHTSPAAVLADVNDALVPEIPPAMFVTCLYAIIDTEAGELVFANAGHNLPYVRTADGVIELRATGMPLGLMPAMPYDEKRYSMASGEVMVLTSDGITEAHDPDGEMYGFSRLMSRVARKPSNGDMVAAVVRDLEEFTGADVEQEDDITLVVVRRTSSAQDSAQTFEESGLILDTFTVASEEGNERIAIDRVTAVVVPLGLDPSRLERLKTAVGETVMNAMEHGNENRPELEVGVEVSATEESISVRVTDQGGDKPIPEAMTPDLEAKLAGEQTPRGWGLFLVEQMVDEVRSTSGGGAHTIELIMNREGAA
ncbi:MAG TPA: SpoIIE family protein phosphatase [Acidimicrobiia bacterium]|nr:SpoIIE family protein phosphatase [Acidimicrobiia bacterium]